MMRMLADLRWNDRQQHHNNTLLYPQLSRPFTQSWMKKLENTFSISALVNILIMDMDWLLTQVVLLKISKTKINI